MLLISLKDNGKLYYDGVETDFVKELALSIDEKEDDVMVTVNYLLSQGLMEVVNQDDEYFLTDLPNLIGSETASTLRSRKSRQQKMLQCNTNATPLQQKCNIEIDIEREIDKDIEKEREGEKENATPPPSSKKYGKFNNVLLTDYEYMQLENQLQEHSQIMIDKLSVYMKSTGKTYQSHYATILNWYQKDKDELSQKKASNTYSTNYEDSDSL